MMKLEMQLLRLSMLKFGIILLEIALQNLYYYYLSMIRKLLV